MPAHRAAVDPLGLFHDPAPLPGALVRLREAGCALPRLWPLLELLSAVPQEDLHKGFPYTEQQKLVWAVLGGDQKLGKWCNSLLWQSFVRASQRAQFRTAGACTTVHDRQEALAVFVVAQDADLALDVQEAQALFSSDLQPGEA